MSREEHITLVVRRTMQATAEQLFAAWTQPEQLKKWWGPRPVTCADAEVDLRVGGAYRIANRLPDGKLLWIFGEFEIVEPPRKLVYTWRTDPHSQVFERVSVQFVEQGEATEVIVTHERIPNPTKRARHRLGWVGCLDGLANYCIVLRGPLLPSPGLPLSALLSQVLVAFTIELDNEFEHQMPHRTTNHGSTPGSQKGPWLVSLAMWSNCMQFVSEQGIAVGVLEDLAGTPTNLNGMERWGYVVVEPHPADSRSKPPHSEWIIRATPKGCQAQKVWRPLSGAIEKRWEARFGKHGIDRLRESLGAVISRMDAELPDCLPILGYGLYSRVPAHQRRLPADGSRSLPALLSKVLLAFTIEFEQESEVSLAIGANVVRVLDEKGVRVRDLPLLSGVSREALHMAMGFLQTRRMIVVAPDPAGSRAKIARLTPKGREAQDVYRRLPGSIEERWQARFGKDIVRTLRELLEALVGEPNAQASPLFRGLEPYPDGWRASVPKLHTLPHYPMVLHRGGFPDGS